MDGLRVHSCNKIIELLNRSQALNILLFYQQRLVDHKMLMSYDLQCIVGFSVRVVHRFRTIEEAVQRERRRGHATLAQLRATSPRRERGHNKRPKTRNNNALRFRHA